MSKVLKKMLAAAKQFKEEQKERGDFEKVDWFAPEIGDNMMRILPHPTDPENELFFQEVHLHYVPTKKNDGGFVSIPVRCLSDFEEECPICIAFAKMVKRDKDKAKNLRTTTRYLYNVINYKEKKVQPYAAPVTVHQEVMSWLEDLESNITDLDSGRDWKVVKNVDPRKSKNLGTSYKARPSMKDSAVPEKLRPLLEGVTPFDTLYSANEKEKMLEFLGIGSKKKDVVEEEEEEEFGSFEDDDDIPFSSKKKTEKVTDDDEDEDVDDEDVKKKAVKSKDAVVKVKKRAKYSEADDDEELDDLDKELQELGVA